ncbi:MAG: hypothetical protein DWQ01_00420 [Planctomycetota bacterium]|nr:MAG: hypothetical protein DWQ01_00420 [Planctomycetota bacterium]
MVISSDSPDPLEFDLEQGLELNANRLEALEFLRLRPVSNRDWPQPGHCLADFRLESELGRGGMGVVYKAKQLSLDRTVALKLIPLSPIQSRDEQRQVLEREGRLLAGLRHEALVTVYAVGVTSAFAWVAMDLVKGCNLRQWIEIGFQETAGNGSRRNRLPALLPVLQRVAGALAEAHRKGIVHRDVKPENILVDDQGRAFLADFGLAREANHGSATFTRAFVGTPRYASPEQIRGEAPSPKSDVFAFGAMAFEAITGQPAFTGRNPVELAQAVQWQEVRWPAGLPVPVDLRAVVEKCLEKRARNRYTHAAEIEAEIERVLRYEPVAALRHGFWVRSWRRAWLRPRRTLSKLALYLLILFAGSAGLIAWMQRDSLQSLELQAALEEADRLFLVGDVEACRATLESLLERGGSPAADGRLGDLHLIAERFPEAERHYRSALSHHKPTLADHLGLALAVNLEREKLLEPRPADLPAPASLRDLTMSAFDYLKRHDYQHAREVLDQALEQESNSFLLRFWRGVALQNLRSLSAALADYRLAHGLRPEHRPTLTGMGAVLSFLGRPQEHVELLQVQLAASGEDPQLLGELAWAFSQQRKYERALSLAERAFFYDPDNPFLRSTYVNALVMTDSMDDAEQVLAQGLEQSPESPHLRHRLAKIFQRKGEVKALQPEASWLLTQEDVIWRIEGLYFLGKLAHDSGDRQEAERIYRQLIQLDPEKAEWYLRLAVVLFEGRQLEQAEKLLDRALSFEPLHGETLFTLGRVQREAGRTWIALRTYERALAVEYQIGWTSYWLADAWTDLGEYGAALRYLELTLVEFPDWADAWALKGLCLHRSGNLKQAESAWARALEFRENPHVRADRAECLDQLGRDQEALAEYQKARKADPKLAPAWCGEGLLRLRSEDAEVRDPGEAIRLLEQAIRLAPEVPEYPKYLEEARLLIDLARQ